MTELQARELQARIMGWEPTARLDCIVEVAEPRLVRVPLRSVDEYPAHDAGWDNLDY